MISDVYTPREANTIKQHLLIPIDYPFVKVGDIRDDTKVSMIRSRTLASNEVQLLIALSSSTPSKGSITFARNSNMEVDFFFDPQWIVRAPEKTCHRWNYRIVFKVYAKPIHKVKTMGVVFTVLADLMECRLFNCLVMAVLYSLFQLVFRLFHRSGWVHRDISAGNVFL